MKISVTAEHITQGTRCSPSCCPIAKAFGDAFFDHCFAVTKEDVNLWSRITGRLVGNINLPVTARNFIFAFDEGDKVTPFEFEINL